MKNEFLMWIKSINDWLGKNQPSSPDLKDNSHIKMLCIKDPLVQNARKGGLSRDWFMAGHSAQVHGPASPIKPLGVY